MQFVSSGLLSFSIVTARPVALQPSGFAAETKTPASPLREGANVLGNGDFSTWDGYRGKGVTITSVGVTVKGKGRLADRPAARKPDRSPHASVRRGLASNQKACSRHDAR